MELAAVSEARGKHELRRDSFYRSRWHFREWKGRTHGDLFGRRLGNEGRVRNEAPSVGVIENYAGNFKIRLQTVFIEGAIGVRNFFFAPLTYKCRMPMGICVNLRNFFTTSLVGQLLWTAWVRRCWRTRFFIRLGTILSPTCSRKPPLTSPRIENTFLSLASLQALCNFSFSFFLN